MATVILKVTENCNATCIYCDVIRKNVAGPKTMPLETLETFFSLVNEYLLNSPRECMEVIWHGGEPLLIGPDYFNQVLEFQQKYCSRTSHRIGHSIQSNLTMFSTEFVDIFRKMGINQIGSSYDPMPSVRGLGKKLNSEAYNKRFLRGVQLLEEEGFGWGLIYVVTKLSLKKPLDIFNFLTNLCINGGVMFNPVLVYGNERQDISITPEEFADFLGTIFPVWWEYRGRYPRVEPFNSLVRNIVYGERRLSCVDSGECAKSHFNLAPDGKVSQCGRSSDWELLDYGSIFDRSLTEIFADTQRDLLLERNRILSDGECNGCRFWSICHGGCPLDSWAETRSFRNKTPWCYAKKGFIEKYLEPITGVRFNPDSVTKSGKELSCNSVEVRNKVKPDAIEAAHGTAYRNGSRQSKVAGNNIIWINPVGGLGDTLMLSGILKQVVEADTSKKFNLIVRTKYPPILKEHPAIAHIGHPPPSANIINTDYWNSEDYGRPGQRAYQILARMFGLKTPAEELLYVPWEFEEDPTLWELVPLGMQKVLICSSSHSPRKQMGIEKWESLVDKFRKDGIKVVQVGEKSDRYIRGAYSLLGLTSPRQLISLIQHFDAVVTSDNFLMHASHLCDVPAVVLWGATDHRVYGYAEQVHLQASPNCDSANLCIGPGQGHLYGTECPEGSTAHCMNQLKVKDVYEALQNILG